ncbi:MAG: enoyl-CoA hydratase [Rhodobacteraceae bacterium]|nr:enoyl-CoA hydratase [Paracoccaceae bacterium]
MTQTLRLADGGLRLDLGRIAQLTLCRPQARNALTRAMWDGLAEAAARINANDPTRVLVISGEGDKAFSAGADIAEFPETYATKATTDAYNGAVRQAQAAIAAVAMPTIAEVRGACFGGGCGLALHCDLRFAAETARFAITPARLGLAYSFEDTARLVTHVGAARAKDILMSGRVVCASEALGIGLVDRVLPDADLAAAVADYANSLAALSKDSIRIAKMTINAIAKGDAAPSPEFRQAFEATFAGPDFAEGSRAFMEKRAPKFK